MVLQWFCSTLYLSPMSDISIGTVSSHNNWIEGEVMGLRPLGTFITFHLKKKTYICLLLHMHNNSKISLYNK